jgi:hypothetical protein
MLFMSWRLSGEDGALGEYITLIFRGLAVTTTEVASMKAKKPTPKRIIWPPRMTPKRKRALALMQEWADKASSLNTPHMQA